MKRDNSRPETRVSVSRKGPLHVHDSLKSDDSFYYRWINRDAEQPYKFVEKLELGYVPVEKSDLDDLRAKYGALVDNVVTEGNYISRPISSKVTAILMKIPKEQHTELQKANEQRVKDTEVQMRRDSRKTGFYGDMKIGHDEIN